MDILQQIKAIEQELILLNKRQESIHPVMHNAGRANEHATSWRQIESLLERVKSIKVELQVDDPGKPEDSQNDSKIMIREWYVEKYPTDELGQEIRPSITFDGLFEILDRRKDVYDFLGVDDSIVRERCFEKLAEIAEVPYSYIYDQWVG